MDIDDYKKYEPIAGKWYFVKKLGSGAYGTVFEVERRDFANMKAALKIISIPASDQEIESYREENYDLDEKSITSYFYGFVESFQHEIQLMMQLAGHSNIVSYMNDEIIRHDGEIGWDILIRMELLTPINRHFKNSSPSEKDVIKLGIDMCKALEVCRKYNIIHRDIKPSNIFISDIGDYKLGDFGVARTLEKTSGLLSKKGTVTYMAPEVYKGQAYDASVDIYSLGIVMYRLMNNNLEPFRTDRTFADAENANFKRMIGEELCAPSNASRELSDIILKACSYEASKRYSSPKEMMKELEDILYGVISTNNTNNSIDVDSNNVILQEINDANILAEEKEATVSIFSTSKDSYIPVQDGPSEKQHEIKSKTHIQEEAEKTIGIFDAQVENNEGGENAYTVQPLEALNPNNGIESSRNQYDQRSVTERVSALRASGYKMRSLEEMQSDSIKVESVESMVTNIDEMYDDNNLETIVSELSKSYKMRTLDDIGSDTKISKDTTKSLPNRNQTISPTKHDSGKEESAPYGGYRMRSLEDMEKN